MKTDRIEYICLAITWALGMVIGIIAIYYINKCDELERDYEILSVKYEASQINYDVNKDGKVNSQDYVAIKNYICLLYTSPSPRDLVVSRMPSSA